MRNPVPSVLTEMWAPALNLNFPHFYFSRHWTLCWEHQSGASEAGLWQTVAPWSDPNPKRLNRDLTIVPRGPLSTLTAIYIFRLMRMTDIASQWIYDSKRSVQVSRWCGFKLNKKMFHISSEILHIFFIVSDSLNAHNSQSHLICTTAGIAHTFIQGINCWV